MEKVYLSRVLFFSAEEQGMVQGTRDPRQIRLFSGWKALVEEKDSGRIEILWMKDNDGDYCVLSEDMVKQFTSRLIEDLSL